MEYSIEKATDAANHINTSWKSDLGLINLLGIPHVMP
jgi:hypothetical protein